MNWKKIKENTYINLERIEKIEIFRDPTGPFRTTGPYKIHFDSFSRTFLSESFYDLESAEKFLDKILERK